MRGAGIHNPSVRRADLALLLEAVENRTAPHEVGGCTQADATLAQERDGRIAAERALEEARQEIAAQVRDTIAVESRASSLETALKRVLPYLHEAGGRLQRNPKDWAEAQAINTAAGIARSALEASEES